jgi:hypothetical protein
MKIRIYIATTNGPVEVQRITREDADVRSVVCLNGTATALPIARAYDAFIKEPTGVVQRSFKHSSYRMDVSAPITDGNSWQLGAFCAHALQFEDRLAGPDDGVENALWLTGEVDRDLNVRPVDHIKEKLLASKDLFEKLRTQNVRLFCFIPGGAGLVPDDEFLESLNVDGDLLRLESVLDVRRIFKRFELVNPYPEIEDDEPYVEGEAIDLYKPDCDAAPPIKDSRPLRMIFLAGMVVAVLAGIYMQFEENIIALRSGSLKLGVSELRATVDKGCNEPSKIPLDQDGAAFPSSDLEGLCGLEITLNNLGAPAYLWAFAQRLEDGHMLLADRESLLQSDLQKGVIGWRLILPKKLNKSIDYRIVALASGAPLGDAINRMLRTQIDAGDDSWEKTKAQLVSEKITVISALHSLEKVSNP